MLNVSIGTFLADTAGKIEVTQALHSLTIRNVTPAVLTSLPFFVWFVKALSCDNEQMKWIYIRVWQAKALQTTTHISAKTHVVFLYACRYIPDAAIHLLTLPATLSASNHCLMTSVLVCFLSSMEAVSKLSTNLLSQPYFTTYTFLHRHAWLSFNMLALSISCSVVHLSHLFLSLALFLSNLSSSALLF